MCKSKHKYVKLSIIVRSYIDTYVREFYNESMLITRKYQYLSRNVTLSEVLIFTREKHCIQQYIKYSYPILCSSAFIRCIFSAEVDREISVGIKGVKI